MARRTDPRRVFGRGTGTGRNGDRIIPQGAANAMDLGLQGKKAIVTGGTRGIGRAIATLLAAEGADVAICARHREGVDQTVATLERAGVKAVGGVVDVADLAALRGWIGEAGAALGGLDIFVANVSALAQGMDEAAWRRGFEIDVMATVFGIEAALPLLERSDSGAIVAVGSTAMAEIYGPPRSYAAVKAALLPYIKALARNLAAKNIRANMVSPGNVFFEGGVWDSVRQNNPEMFAQILARNPTGRMGKPEEVADAVVFLASPRASFITGTNLIIDGALTQRVQY